MGKVKRANHVMFTALQVILFPITLMCMLFLYLEARDDVDEIGKMLMFISAFIGIVSIVAGILIGPVMLLGVVVAVVVFIIGLCVYGMDDYGY